jgi:serine/threonine protein kinase/tetratricopeptide (TPR) repeat protein
MSERDIFIAALQKDDAAQRQAYLDEACTGQPVLREQVEELLRLHANAGSFLEQPPDAGATSDHVVPGRWLDPADNRPGSEGPGSRVGLYKLLEQIGEGGFGVVFMAEQSQPVRRKVALKILKPGMDTRQVVARFEAERQALALMDHAHIARILDGGTTESGRPYFVMELVKGLPISDYCDQARLTPRQRLELFVSVCQAVQHAHQKGIIHRDLKPSNVLVTVQDGAALVKVIDFGIAKALGQQLTDKTVFTGFAQMIGTPLYMSPEQAALSNVDVDTRSDVYSLGVLLYELLTGTTPFDRERLRQVDYDEMRRIIREEEPPRPSTRISTLGQAGTTVSAQRSCDARRLSQLCRGELDWIVMKCLEKDRSRRYESASALALDIQCYLAGEPVLAAPPSARYRLRKLAQKHRAALLVAAALSLVLVAGTAISVWQAVRATQAQQAATERLRQIEKVNEILASIFENLDPREIARNDRPLQAVLVEKLDRAVQQLEGEAIGDALVVAAMQNKLGSSLLGLGEPGKAIVLLEKARDTCKAQHGPDHPQTLGIMHNLALAYQDAGKLDLAEPLYQETLDLTIGRLGPDDPSTLTTMNNLAGAYRAAGKLDLAVPLFKETLERRTAQLGPDDPSTLITMNNLAGAYQDAGKLDLAVPLFKKTFDLQQARLGPNHPDTLTTMSNLAGAYQAAGKRDLALPLCEETLRRRKDQLGPNHSSTLASMNSLAEAYRDAGKLDLAVPLHEKTLELQQARVGPEHPHTLASMNNLALAYQQAGKLDRALPMFEETVRLRQARVGRDHLDTLASMNNLAMAYRDAGKLDRAMPLFEETLRRTRARLGPDHPSTLASMHNLALGYQAVGKVDRAVPLFEETLKGAIAKLGPDHPHTLTTMMNLGRCLCLTGQGEKAATIDRQLITGVRRHYPPNHPGFAGLLAQVALDLLQVRQYPTAEQMLRESLAIRTKTEPDAWTTFNTQSMLGGALLGQKKYADAEPLLRASYEGMKQREKTIPPQGKARLSEAVERLVQLYEATGKKDEAARWRKEREALRTAAKGAKTS